MLRPGVPSLGDILSAVSRYGLVVTDTYHLAINAWRAGTPAVCIGTPQPGAGSWPLTLTDLKKHVLYLMYDASDLYITPGDFSRPASGRSTAARLASILADEDSTAAILARIRLHAMSAETRFLAKLDSVLQQSLLPDLQPDVARYRTSREG